jgi:hypothetical protein
MDRTKALGVVSRSFWRRPNNPCLILHIQIHLFLRFSREAPSGRLLGDGDGNHTERLPLFRSKLVGVDKIDSLILAIQRELQQHNLDTFQVEVSPGGPKVTVVGCTLCRKPFGTTNQLIARLAEDAIPALFARLRKKT